MSVFRDVDFCAHRSAELRFTPRNTLRRVFNQELSRTVATMRQCKDSFRIFFVFRVVGKISLERLDLVSRAAS